LVDPELAEISSIKGSFGSLFLYEIAVVDSPVSPFPFGIWTSSLPSLPLNKPQVFAFFAEKSMGSFIFI